MTCSARSGSSWPRWLPLAVGSVLAAVAPNLGVMIVARAIQGLGGGTLPLGFGIIRDEFPTKKR